MIFYPNHVSVPACTYLLEFHGGLSAASRQRDKGPCQQLLLRSRGRCVPGPSTFSVEGRPVRLVHPNALQPAEGDFFHVLAVWLTGELLCQARTAVSSSPWALLLRLDSLTRISLVFFSGFTSLIDAASLS